MSQEINQLLSTGAQRIVELAREKKAMHNHSYLGANHWMLALLERHGPMLQSMYNEIDVEKEKDVCETRLKNNELGINLKEEKVASEAAKLAKARSKLQGVERDVALVVLSYAGYVTSDVRSNSSHSEVANPLILGKGLVTPTLDQFGKDLTRAAREGKIPPIIGRDDEIQVVIETLCRRTKRNPVLVGPAGVGKTAIIEGLAKRIVEGNVPALMQGVRIIALQPSTLVAGANIAGELEKRMQNVIKEASQEGIFLFIDEIHSIMGTGGMMGTSDMASILKPSLARGEIALIAATTDDEYRRFIETDSALERRFQPIRIHELSPDETFQVLISLRAVLDKQNSIQVGDEVLRWLVDFGNQYMRNRHFPDKAVDLLEQCFAHAVANGKNTLHLDDAVEVAQRMIGMPLILDQRLDNLKKEFENRAIFSEEITQIILNRLQVTMRGLDLRSAHPNAIILLSGDAIQQSETISEIFAEALFGSSDRVIAIDLARFTHPADINLLVGSPPGYVGYSESLPIHRLIQTPWSVLKFENIHACFPTIREVICQALESGWLTDGRGKHIYLSDTVVILTAEVNIQSQRGIGFRAKGEENTTTDLYQAVVDAIGNGLADMVDLFWASSMRVGNIDGQWLRENLLEDISQRYKKQGIEIQWDDSLVDWPLKRQEFLFSEKVWERWVDQVLSPTVIPHLPKHGMPDKSVVVAMQEDQILIQISEKGR